MGGGSARQRWLWYYSVFSLLMEQVGSGLKRAGAAHFSGSTVAFVIRSLSYSERQLGHRAGRLSFAAFSTIWCQHQRHMLYPQSHRLAAWSVTSIGSMHSGHVSSSSSSIMAAGGVSLQRVGAIGVEVVAGVAARLQCGN